LRSSRPKWGFHPRPEWFDHFLDQHWQFSAKNNGLWVERGVFSRMVLKPNAKMLEICCGDGFNARHFYSSRAASIVALDFNKDAIPHAKRYNSVPNITYVQKDVREGLPTGPFDNIVWDAATPRACPCLRTGKRAVQFFNIDSAILPRTPPAPDSARPPKGARTAYAARKKSENANRISRGDPAGQHLL
jgi:SAM-dependent methyltransferase